jgi:uncharacterized membrane protein
MGLVVLVIGLIILLGAHVFVTCRQARAALVARIGEAPYKLLFSLVSLVGIVVIVWGFGLYRASGYIQVWVPPTWMRHVTVALMWPAVICVVAAYVRGNIARTLKHPLLVGVKTWALAHLLANGDLGGIILFGAVMLWAGYDRVTLKRRSDPGAPAIPYGGWGNDVIAVVVGTILYLALGLLFHPLFIGIPVMGTPTLGS